MLYIANKGKTVICNHTFLDSGMSHKVVISTENANAEITIGDNCYIGCQVYAGEKVTIGDACIIAGGVAICDNDGHSPSVDRKKRHTSNSKIKPVQIGNNVWICARSIVQRPNNR